MTDLNKGNSYILKLQLFDTDNNPVDITDTQDIQYIMRKSVNSTSNFIQKSLTSGISIPEPTDGIVEIKLDNADTDDLDIGRAYHEALLIDNASNYTTILCENIKIIDKLLF